MTDARVTSTSAERRADIGPAAMAAFAARGFYGTTTNEVAAAAGISQAYLYKLFPDKTAIFVEAVRFASDRLADTLTQVFRELGDHFDPVQALAEATRREANDLDLSALLLHAAAAAAEPAIGAAIRECYARQVTILTQHSAATDAQMRHYFADAIVATIARQIGATSSRAAWARVLTSTS